MWDVFKTRVPRYIIIMKWKITDRVLLNVGYKMNRRCGIYFWTYKLMIAILLICVMS